MHAENISKAFEAMPHGGLKLIQPAKEKHVTVKVHRTGRQSACPLTEKRKRTLRDGPEAQGHAELPTSGTSLYT